MPEAAVRDEILLRNVSERCSLPRVTQKQVRAITTAELSRFLKAIDGKQFRNIFFIDIFFGYQRSSGFVGMMSILKTAGLTSANSCSRSRSQAILAIFSLLQRKVSRGK